MRAPSLRTALEDRAVFLIFEVGEPAGNAGKKRTHTPADDFFQGIREKNFFPIKFIVL
jgi:hypothetical protein